MDILIGENIKRLRKTRNITQEELAEIFNITPAAVCKWETNETYPDITLLFPLAHYFGVTVDELMGYDEQKIQNEINQIVEDYWYFYFNDYSKATNLIEDAYHKYPNDCYISHLYMWNKAGGNADNDPTILLQNKEEFLTICDRILNNSNDITLCLNTWNMKAKIMHAEGKTKDALEIYDEKYPNFYNTNSQKKEQLFAKDTKEFHYYLSLNIYELTDFVLNKKMKEIWFCHNATTKEKIRMSYTLLEAIETMRNNYQYDNIILGEYTVISNLEDYLMRFDKNSKSISGVLEKKEQLKKMCNKLATKNENMKAYIKKAYNIEVL